MKSFLISFLVASLLLSGAIFVVQAQNCDSAIDYLSLGKNAFDSGDLNGALAAYNCAAELFPSNPIVLNRRGWTYYQLGNYRAAWEDFDEAIDLDFTYPYPYNNRGLVYYYWGDFEAALADFEKAIEYGYEPLSVPQGHRDRTLAKLGQNPAPAVIVATPTAEATTIPSTESPAETPQLIVPTFTPSAIPAQDEEATLDEALRLYRLGDYEAATTVFSLLNQSGSALCHRSYMYMSLGSYDYALLYFDEAIRQNACFNAPAYRVYVLAQLGEFDRAVEAYNAIDIDSLSDMGYLYILASYPFISDQVTAPSLDVLYRKTSVQPSQELVMDVTTRVDMEYAKMFPLTFEGAAGETITITALDASTDVVDVMIALVDPNDVVIALSDDSELGYDSLIENFELPLDGEYTLMVTHAGGGETGPVDVLLVAGEPAQ